MRIADEKHPEKGKDVHRAEYMEHRDVVLNQCKERDDEETFVIEHLVRSCSYFIAAAAHYHNMRCNLFNIKAKTKTMAPGMKGRPGKDSDGFKTLCEWMETEGELYTLGGYLDSSPMDISPTLFPSRQFSRDISPQSNISPNHIFQITNKKVIKMNYLN